MNRNIWPLHSSNNLILNAFILFSKQHKIDGNKGIKSFYPVTWLKGLLNLLVSSFHASKTDNIFTLYDLIHLMYWNKQSRDEREMKKWKNQLSPNSWVHPSSVWRIKPRAVNTSSAEILPILSLQLRLKCCITLMIALAASLRACMSYLWLHQTAKQHYSPFEKSPDSEEGGGAICLIPEHCFWCLIL